MSAALWSQPTAGHQFERGDGGLSDRMPCRGLSSSTPRNRARRRDRYRPTFRTGIDLVAVGGATDDRESRRAPGSSVPMLYSPEAFHVLAVESGPLSMPTQRTSLWVCRPELRIGRAGERPFISGGAGLEQA